MFLHFKTLQGRRDNQALMKVEQEVIEARREKENLQTVVDTLKQQNKNLQIEKDTEVESLSKQVRYFCLIAPENHLQFPQVSSLNARAAHTQNQQLALVQEENKKLISELTVLQTQVMNTSRNLKVFMFCSVCRLPRQAMKRTGCLTMSMR